MLQGRTSRAEAKAQRLSKELANVSNALCESRAETEALQAQLSTEAMEKRQLQVRATKYAFVNAYTCAVAQGCLNWPAVL